MSGPITSVTQTPVAPEVTAPQPKAPEVKTAEVASKALPKDTVAISNAAKAAVQEAMETVAQTTQEASKGDQQAQRVLAKLQAAKQ
jgi:hypothetical protein